MLIFIDESGSFQIPNFSDDHAAAIVVFPVDTGKDRSATSVSWMSAPQTPSRTVISQRGRCAQIASFLSRNVGSGLICGRFLAPGCGKKNAREDQMGYVCPSRGGGLLRRDLIWEISA